MILELMAAAVTGIELLTEVTAVQRSVRELNDRKLDFRWVARLGHLSEKEEAKLLRQQKPYCVLERARRRTQVAKAAKKHKCPQCGNKSALLVTPGEFKLLQEKLPALTRAMGPCPTCGGLDEYHRGGAGEEGR